MSEFRRAQPGISVCEITRLSAQPERLKAILFKLLALQHKEK